MKNIIITLCILIASFAQAAGVTKSNQLPVKSKILKTETVMPKATKPIPVAIDPGTVFGLEFNPRYSFGEKQTDGSRAEYITYEFVPSIKTQNYSLKMTSAFNYQTKDQTGNEWDNTLFDGTTNSPWALGPYFNLSPNILLSLPLFKRTDDFQNFIGARLTLALNSKNADVPNLILKYGVQFGKLNFKNTQTAGNFNIDTRLRQRIHLGYQITEQLLAFIYFHLDSNFLNDNSVKNAFYHESFLQYSFNDNFNTSIGLTNGGGVFKGKDQEEDNLKFYDKNSSEIFVALGFAI